MAFYSPMMHAKRNSYAKFQQNLCGFGPPGHAFYDFGLVGSKNAKFIIHKKIKMVLEQEGSFCREWRAEQML